MLEYNMGSLLVLTPVLSRSFPNLFPLLMLQITLQLCHFPLELYLKLLHLPFDEDHSVLLKCESVRGFVHLSAVRCPKQCLPRVQFMAVRSHQLGTRRGSHFWPIFSIASWDQQQESLSEWDLLRGLVWLQWLREQLSRIHLLHGIWPLEGQETWTAQLVCPVGLPEDVLSLFSSGILSISKTAAISDQLYIRRSISCTYISEAK